MTINTNEIKDRVITDVEMFDIENPVGEQKRIVAGLKSFGARNYLHVMRSDSPVPELNSHEVIWYSGGGHFKDRKWQVALLLEDTMRSPTSTALLSVTGANGEWYHYRIPRQLLDKFLTQRLGNDYIQYLSQVAPTIFTDLGGFKSGRFYTMPSNMQWALGHVGFQLFREDVQDAIRRRGKMSWPMSPSD